MSTESRLKRLGLWHLHDQPEALSKELARRIARDSQKSANGRRRTLQNLSLSPARARDAGLNPDLDLVISRSSPAGATYYFLLIAHPPKPHKTSPNASKTSKNL